MFLFLSGYGLDKSYKQSGLRSYWWKKLTRIGVPWLIWCCIFFALSKAVNVLQDNYFFLRYWYLEYLFVWYVLFWVSNSLFSERVCIIVLSLSAILMFFIWPNLQAEQSLSFVSGVVFSRIEEKIVSKNYDNKWKYVLPITLFLYATLFLIVKQFPSIRGFGEESLLMKFVQINIKYPYSIAIISMVILFKTPLWLNKIIHPVGLLSLELYLVQMQFFALINGSTNAFFCILFVVIILSIILYYLDIRLNKVLGSIKIHFKWYII